MGTAVVDEQSESKNGSATAPAAGGANVGRAGAPEQVTLHPIGTPLPLGFVGLLVATTVLAALELGWIPIAQQHQVGLVLLAFAFPLQGVSAVFCLVGRDAPAGAGIWVQGATWLAVGLLLLTGVPGARSEVLAVFLFAAAAALVPAATSSALGKLIPGLVMLGAAARFVLTGVFEAGGGSGWEHAAGWEGLVLAALALYAALAVDLEAALRRTVLPLGRRRAGRWALHQHLGDQRPELDREPGIRPQL